MLRSTPLILMCLIAALLLGAPQSGEAWGSKTHYKVTSDAYHIMPKAFRVYLGETGSGSQLKKPAMKGLMEGCVEPDRVLKDFQNHVYHIHGSNMGNGPFKVEQLADEVVEDIKNRVSRKVIVQKLGWLSHYIADLAQPLHTGIATWEGIEEKSYHSKCEKDSDKHVYTYGVHFDGAHQVKRISARMIYEALWANQYYDHIQSAYTSGRKYLDAKPIIEKCYSRAVNNVVDIWYSIWARAGGRINPKVDEKGKYYPPAQKFGDPQSLPQATFDNVEADGSDDGDGRAPDATLAE